MRNHQDRGEKSSLAEWQGGNKAGSYIQFCTIGEVSRYIQVPVGSYRGTYR